MTMKTVIKMVWLNHERDACFTIVRACLEDDVNKTQFDMLRSIEKYDLGHPDETRIIGPVPDDFDLENLLCHNG